MMMILLYKSEIILRRTYVHDTIVIVGATVLCWWGGSRPSAYVGIVGLRVWTPTKELGISIPRGSRPSNRVGIVETYNYKHGIVLLA